MIEKPASDLSFVYSKEPLPTLEVDVDSIPKSYSGYSEIIENTLRPFVLSNPSVRATIYVYQGTSINFQNRPTQSAFLAVARSKVILNELFNGFNRIRGIKARFSDYIRLSEAIPEFHVQDGFIWCPLDAVTWYTSGEGDKDLAVDKSRHSLEDSIKRSISEEENTELARTPISSRFRSARSDASIGSIRKAIEKHFGLPEGSVALCGPDGKPLRADAKIGTLRKRWE
ncbi:MAG: hypothetical protein ACOZFS_13470 [Thermodesulfobacteriota bacterium]